MSLDPADRTLTAKLTAEALGTFALCFVGILAIYNARGAFGGSAALVSVALAHGLTIAVMASAFMLLSGAHFNPAVTFACWLGKQITSRDALLYVAVQFLGGLLGALLASLALDGTDLSDGVPGLRDDVSATSGILVEAVLTLFLVLVVYGTGVDSRFGARIGGLAIGLTVTLDILAGGPLTGAAMNPARWLGPAIVEGDVEGIAASVYLIGPLLGGLLGGLLYTRLLRPGLAP